MIGPRHSLSRHHEFGLLPLLLLTGSFVAAFMVVLAAGESIHLGTASSTYPENPIKSLLEGYQNGQGRQQPHGYGHLASLPGLEGLVNVPQGVPPSEIADYLATHRTTTTQAEDPAIHPGDGEQRARRAVVDVDANDDDGEMIRHARSAIVGVNLTFYEASGLPFPFSSGRPARRARTNVPSRCYDLDLHFFFFFLFFSSFPCVELLQSDNSLLHLESG